MLLLLLGCGGLPSDPVVTGATVVFAAFEGTDEDAPTISSIAVVIIGGVRGLFNGPAEEELILKGIPLGTGATHTAPMTVTAPGYRTVSQQLTLRTDMATFADISMVKVDLTLTGTVAGTVVGTDGTPLVNAPVTFTWDEDGTAKTLQGFTDQSGAFVVGGIPIGAVTVEAVAAGYLPESRDITVDPDTGGTNPDLSFSLINGETTVVVAGVVTELGTETPIAGARVTIGDYPSVVSDQSGSFQVPGVLVGSRTVTVTLTGYDDYTSTIEVLPGMAELAVVMSRISSQPPEGPYTLAGTVVLSGSTTSAGATVVAFSLDRGLEIARTTTDAQGHYYLFVPAGRYEITVSYKGKSISRELEYAGGGRIVEGIDFTLTVAG